MDEDKIKEIMKQKEELPIIMKENKEQKDKIAQEMTIDKWKPETKDDWWEAVNSIWHQLKTQLINLNFKNDRVEPTIVKTQLLVKYERLKQEKSLEFIDSLSELYTVYVHDPHKARGEENNRWFIIFKKLILTKNLFKNEFDERTKRQGFKFQAECPSSICGNKEFVKELGGWCSKCGIQFKTFIPIEAVR
jgi:hypothetical protein